MPPCASNVEINMNAWIKDKLEWAAYIAFGLFITSVICLGMIWLTIELDSALQGLM